MTGKPIAMWVTDRDGCDFCASTGLVESPLDSRLEECCPMCRGNGCLTDDEWYVDPPAEETYEEWVSWVEGSLR